jgi:RNA polymerase sigma-70 factor (ECF subfamily)
MNWKKLTVPMQKTQTNHESQWLERARQGDEEAFARIIERYQIPVYNLCHRMLADPYEAEDAAQETFLKAYRSLSRYDMNKKFINWVLTIASNHCVDRLRKRRLNLVSFDDIVPGSLPMENSAGPEAALVKQEDQETIQAMLRRLRPRDRAAIVLKYWYEMSYEEIAETLSLTVSAVKSRLHRARHDMAANWVSLQSQPVMLKRRPDEAPTV